MAFSEKVKLEAKQRANFCCVICKQPFVDVHHIKPQSEGGSDTIENSAPLCGSCHDLFGGNPDKRKQIREMRDFCWKVCEKKNASPDLVLLNQRLDVIQSEMRISRASDSKALEGIKQAYLAYHKTSGLNIAALVVTPGYDLTADDYTNVGLDVANLSETPAELHNIVGQFWTDERFIFRASIQPARRIAAKASPRVFVYYDFSLPMLHKTWSIRLVEWSFRTPTEGEFIPIGVRVVSSETPWQATNWRVVRDGGKVRITTIQQ